MTPGWVRAVEEMEGLGYEVMLTPSIDDVAEEGWTVLFGQEDKRAGAIIMASIRANADGQHGHAGSIPAASTIRR